MILALPLVAFVLAFAACWLWLYVARRAALVDRPNERSAHRVETPHGGGVGLLLGLAGGMLIAAWLGVTWPELYWRLLVLLVVLAVVGLVDDLRGLGIGLRFAVYGLACVYAVWLLVRSGLFAPSPLVLAMVFYLLWMLNLYNFMDGTDGFAGSEGLFVSLAAAGLTLASGGSTAYALLCLLLAAACLGFLAWNRPPALLFMGDAGSVPLGFLLAVLSLQGAAEGGPSLVAWLILLGVFIVDASYTLAWRVLTGQPFTRAHSLHFYQRLRRHWDGHGRVLALLWAINLLWLLPLAVVAERHPDYQLALLALAWIPLVLAMTRAVKFP